MAEETLRPDPPRAPVVDLNEFLGEVPTHPQARLRRWLLFAVFARLTASTPLL